MHTVRNYIHTIVTVVIIFTVVPSCDLMICIVTNVAVPAGIIQILSACIHAPKWSKFVSMQLTL